MSALSSFSASHKVEVEEVEEEDDGGLYGLFVSEEYKEVSWFFDDFEQKLLCSTSSSTDHDLTGQIVWPASVLLAWFVYRHQDKFKDKAVIELGAGCGLGGFLAAHWSKQTLLTDGNEIVVRLMAQNQAFLKLDPAQHSVAMLLWGQQEALSKLLREKNFDTINKPCVVIGADVILWPNQIIPLMLTIYWLLRSSPRESVCYISYVVRAQSTTRRLFATARQVGLEVLEFPLLSFLSEEEVVGIGAAEKHLFRFALDVEREELVGGALPSREAMIQEHLGQNPAYAMGLPC